MSTIEYIFTFMMVFGVIIFVVLFYIYLSLSRVISLLKEHNENTNIFYSKHILKSLLEHMDKHIIQNNDVLNSLDININKIKNKIKKGN